MSDRRRPVVRVVATDEDGCVLLCRHVMDGETDHDTLWLVPGGGVRRGESLLEAGVRELREETGHRVETIGPPIAARRKSFRWKEERVDAVAYYHRLRTPRFEPEPHALSPAEQQTLREYRWWTPDELRSTDELIVPPEWPEIFGSQTPLTRVADWGVRRLFLTVGHSNRSIDEFGALLTDLGVDALVDVRSAPYSRRFPWFRRDPLRDALAGRSIEYVHLVELGGRRPDPDPDERWSGLDERWRGYAAHMQSPGFADGVRRLEQIAQTHTNVALMCAERDHRHCHRHLLSDALWRRGHAVLHADGPDRLVPHFPHPRLQISPEGTLHYPAAQGELFGD